MSILASLGMGFTLTLAGVFAQSGGNVEPVSIVLTGVGGTTVIGVMAWIVKKVVSGEMVPLPIRTLTETMQTVVAKQDKIIDQLMVERQDHKEMIRSNTEAQFAVHEIVRLSSGQYPPLPSRQFSRANPHPSQTLRGSDAGQD